MLYKIDNEEPEEPDAIIFDIRIVLSETPQSPDEKYGYNQKLNKFRNQIDMISSDIWKKVRWYINLYDFQVKDPIINRAFYKYWEIVNEFEIFKEYNANDTDTATTHTTTIGGSDC